MLMDPTLRVYRSETTCIKPTGFRISTIIRSLTPFHASASFPTSSCRPRPTCSSGTAVLTTLALSCLDA